MATRFVCRNVFETDPDTFWAKVFFEDDYNRGLYLEGLGFKSYTPISLDEKPDGTKVRRFRTEPKSEAPAVVTKLIGGALDYEETGTFDPKTKIWSYQVRTSKMAEKVRIGGKYWLEARGEKRLERICEVDIAVDVFGVGGVVESFIEKTTRDSYVRATEFTNAYLRRKGYDKA